MKSALAQPGSTTRPVVYDYRNAHEFLRDLLAHYKLMSNFSIRQRSLMLRGCSPSLVSQVLAGNRRLTRDQLPTFAKLFKLNAFEFEFVDRNLRHDIWPLIDALQSRSKKREAQNHILNHWLNVYVKDLVNLHGFTLDVKVLSQMLMGIAAPKQIESSIAFLLREGFWRRTPANRIVAEQPAVVSTNEIPNGKIRDFHKRALKLALRGLEVFPTDRRKASTVLISLPREKVPELRSLIDTFQNQLLQFIEENPDGRDELLQVTINLTPIGSGNVET